MTVKIPLFTSGAGITHELVCDDDGTAVAVESSADVQDILDLNHAMATENDGYSPTRDLRRAASVPWILREKWKNEEGFDAYNPNHWDALRKKLNDIDYRKLRTAPGYL